jgi:hypothetical protein
VIAGALSATALGGRRDARDRGSDGEDCR